MAKATEATEAAAARVSGIGRACYLLTGITTFSGIIDYAHISTHAHTNTLTQTDRQTAEPKVPHGRHSYAQHL